MNQKPNSHQLPAKAILDNLSVAVIVLDKNLNIQCINPAAENMLYITSTTALTKKLPEITRFNENICKQLEQSVSIYRPFSMKEEELIVNYTKSIHVDFSVTPYFDEQGEVFLIVEMQRVDRHLRIVREEALLEQQKATRILVRGLAHEIKNPLGGLRGAAQLLEAELPNESLREYTDIIIDEADRLKNLMNRMLGPNSRPKLQAVNIHEVTEYVRKLIQVEKPESVRVSFDYDPSIPELNADKEWLIQAVLNIASNALQAVLENGWITFKTRALRRYTIGTSIYRLVVLVQIIDNGSGVEADMLEKIFYPMITTKAEGTGLGLSIAQSLINEHGGLIECKSCPGKTVFSVLIPIREE